MVILGIPHPASRIPHPVKTFNPEFRAPIFICFQILKPSLRKHPFLRALRRWQPSPRCFRLGHSWTLPWAVTSPRDIRWERSVARSLPDFARITDRIGSAGTFRAEERNVPSGEERGETDVFVGYLKHGLQIIQIKQIPHPKRPIVDPHIGSFLPFTSYFLNSWLKLEKHHYFLKYHFLCISS